MTEKDGGVFSGVMRGFGIFAIAVVGIGVFSFSAANNFALFLGIFETGPEGYVMSALGLTILDIAAVGWVVYGVSGAHGVFQRMVSWLSGGICLALALAAAISELIIRQEYTARPEWIGALAITSIVIGFIVNAVAITLNHIINPGTMLEIKVGIQKDKLKADIAQTQLGVLSLAASKAKAQLTGAADKLASTLSEELYRDGVAELLGYTPGGDNSTQLPAPRQSQPVSDWKVSAPPRPANPTYAFGGGNMPKPAAPRHDSVETVEGWQDDDDEVQNAPVADPKGKPRVTGTSHPLSHERVWRPLPKSSPDVQVAGKPYSPDEDMPRPMGH